MTKEKMQLKRMTKFNMTKDNQRSDAIKQLQLTGEEAEQQPKPAKQRKPLAEALGTTWHQQDEYACRWVREQAIFSDKHPNLDCS